MKVLSVTTRKSLVATVTAAAFISTVQAQTQACISSCEIAGSIAAQEAFSSVIQNVPSCYKLTTDAAVRNCVNYLTAVANSAADSARISATQDCLRAC